MSDTFYPGQQDYIAKLNTLATVAQIEGVAANTVAAQEAADEAAASALAASGSASAASGSGSAAAASALAADNSADAAALSETNAGLSEDAAAASALAADNSADAAEVSNLSAGAHSAAASASATSASASAISAASSASNASTSAANALINANLAAANIGAVAYVSGATYAAGTVVYSALTGRSYRRLTTGSGTTDPSIDTTNYVATLLEIQTGLPTIRPSLLLDFVNSRSVDPRITFTRASAASYYDGKTFAKAEENLLFQSQTFSTTWGTTAASVTPDTTVAPDSTTTADTLVEDNQTVVHIVQQTVSFTAGTYTFSVFAKLGTGSRFLTIGLSNSSLNHSSATFDLSTGVATNSQSAGTFSSASAVITAAANGFYRCSITVTTSDSVNTPRIGLNNTGTPTTSNRSFGENYAGDGTSSIIIWGAQLEQRSQVTAYTPTTTAPITRYIPKLMTAPAGVPRLDFDPITLACRGLRVEESRTNLLLWSDQFDNAYWPKVSCNITSNVTTAPDGTLTMDKFAYDSAASSSISYLNLGFTKAATSAAYTLSFYAKAAEKAGLRLYVRDSATSANFADVTFNLTNGTAVSAATSGGTFSAASSTISDAGNGVYRCALTFTCGTETSWAIRTFIRESSGAGFTGDGTSGIYIWGAQLEAGAFPTSYIPTTTAAATRAADVAVMTGTNFTDWWNPSEGTWVVEASTTYPAAAAGVIFVASDGTANERVQVAFGSSTISTAVTVGGVSQVSGLTESAATANAVYKAALSYKVNDFAQSVNGSPVDTDTAGLVPTGVTQLQIGHRTTWLNGHIRRIAYYPKRLSNIELQALSAL